MKSAEGLATGAHSRLFGAAGHFRHEGGKHIMNHMGSQKPSRQSPGRVVLVSVVITLVVLAPCTLAEMTAHQANMAVTVQAVSTPVEESRVAAAQAASATELQRAVRRAATQHRLHPALLFAVMKAESSFNPIVVSKAGAVGLMQLLLAIRKETVRLLLIKI